MMLEAWGGSVNYQNEGQPCETSGRVLNGLEYTLEQALEGYAHQGFIHGWCLVKGLPILTHGYFQEGWKVLAWPDPANPPDLDDAMRCVLDRMENGLSYHGIQAGLSNRLFQQVLTLQVASIQRPTLPLMTDNDMVMEQFRHSGLLTRYVDPSTLLWFLDEDFMNAHRLRPFTTPPWDLRLLMTPTEAPFPYDRKESYYAKGNFTSR
jgi:hypothetical protein